MLEEGGLLDLQGVDALKLALGHGGKLGEGEQGVGGDLVKGDGDLLAVDSDAGEGLVEDVVGLAALDGGEGGDEHRVGHRGLGHELDAPLDVLGSDLVTVVPVGVVPEVEGQGFAVGAILIGGQGVRMVRDGIEVLVGHDEVAVDRLVIDVGTGVEPRCLEELLGAAVGVDELFASGAGAGHGGLTRLGRPGAVRLLGVGFPCPAAGTGGEAEYQGGTEQETCRAFP